MPKSSSALPASRMISRSESLPITIETNGLLIDPLNVFLLSCSSQSWSCRVGIFDCVTVRFARCHFAQDDKTIFCLFLCESADLDSLLQRSARNIFSIMRAVERNLSTCFIRSGYRGGQIRSSRRYSQHSASDGVIGSVALRSSRVEHFHALDTRSAV